MRVSIGVVCLVLAAAIASAGDSTDRPEKPRQPVNVKAAWQWSLEERIASRIDPASIRQRAEADERELRDGRTLASVQVHAAGIGPIEFTIDGRRNPELLMPFELFGSLLRGVDARFRNEARVQYRQSIAAFGWREEAFWPALESAASDFFSARDESLALQDRLPALSPPERRELEGKIEELDYKQCRLRAEALQRVRSQLGRETFDRFLYTAVAPEISIGSRTPVGDEAGRLRFIEGGCR